jgi:hypothetical protein
MPVGVKELVDVGSFFLRGLGAVADTGVKGVQILGSGIAAGVEAARDVFRPSQAQLQALFAAFDVDGSGFIDREELHAALNNGGKVVTPEDCADILAQVDTNNDGVISFEEFEAAFKLAPDAMTKGVRELVDVSAVLLDGLGAVAGSVADTGISLADKGLSLVNSGLTGLKDLVASPASLVVQPEPDADTDGMWQLPPGGWVPHKDGGEHASVSNPRIPVGRGRARRDAVPGRPRWRTLR